MNRIFGRPYMGAVLLALAGCVTVEDRPVVETGAGETVSPVLQAPAGRVFKRKVAIARFSNETMYGKSPLLAGDKGGLIGKKASDILATRLARSGKFMLFERSDSTRLLQALDDGDLGGMKLPADYLIVGSLSEYGRGTTGETGFLSRTKKQRAYAKVNIRLVEVATSRVIYSEEGAGEALRKTGTVMGMGSKAGYDSALGEKAISAAISKLVSKVVENLLARPWRSGILSREGGDIYIAGGRTQGLKAGDRLALVRRGKRVKNPQTDLIMELPGRRVAVLEVTSTFGTGPTDEGSICKVVDGSAPIAGFEEYRVEEMK